jgi:hypothetical protein
MAASKVRRVWNQELSECSIVGLCSSVNTMSLFQGQYVPAVMGI